MDWKDYQNKTAELFRAVGCKAEIEAVVKGVRGEHEIDVFVEFEKYGAICSWAIECKYWNTNVPKEKVLALQAIVDDIGADRGFLISKTGFQSGAIRSAQKSNITLTSLEDLAEVLKHDTTKIILETLESKLLEIRHQIFGLSIKEKMGKRKFRRYYPEGISYNQVVRHIGILSILEIGFTDIKLGKNRYPLRVSDDGKRIESTDSIEEFIKAVQNQLSISALWLNSLTT